MIKRLLTMCMFALAAPVALAGPIRFDFAYQEPQGDATATGYIVFESTEVANPGGNEFDLPSSAVLDLSITIVNADAGNGTFGLADFSRVWFDTNGGTLDFSRSLMGQPTNGLPWGTPPPNEGGGDARGGGGISSGDFNLFVDHIVPPRTSGYGGRAPSGVATPAPNGVWYYTLGTNGGSGGNTLALVAFGPQVSHHSVPTNSGWAISALLLMVLGAGIVVTRRRINHS